MVCSVLMVFLSWVYLVSLASRGFRACRAFLAFLAYLACRTSRAVLVWFVVLDVMVWFVVSCFNGVVRGSLAVLAVLAFRACVGLAVRFVDCVCPACLV